MLAVVRRPRRLVPLLVLLFLHACSGGPAGPEVEAPEEITELPRPLTASEMAVLERSNDFAFGLLREVAGVREPGDNVFLSPLSASMALGMTMNGAAGGTYDEMRDMLGFEGMAPTEINGAYRGLIELLETLDPTVEMRLANSIWHRDELQPAPAFLGTVRESFDAEVSGLDFSAPDAAGIINSWVQEQTNGRIEEIVDDPISPSTVMFLLNAVYFNGAWTQAFDPAETRPRAFTLADGSTVEVSTMAREPESGPLLRATSSGWSAVEMPYGGQAFAMTILLPADPTGSLDALVPELDAATWSRIVQDLAQTDAGIEMPRFRLAYDAPLNAPLQALGMEQAFDPMEADFSPMTGGANGLYVEKVKQKTWVDVHEEGTEAAAVTSVEIGVTSAGPPPTVRVDRPFIVAIRERISGTILFLGLIEDPRDDGGG